MERLRNFRQDESGQDLIEYSLIITFIAIACLALIAGEQPATNAIWAAANAQIIAANRFAGGR